MSKIKLSLSIPYKQRLKNIDTVFTALSNQTMERTEFEVIVGAMEYSEEYIDLCKRYTDQINIVSILSAEEFSIPRARNLAMRQASGLVVVQMDADTLFPENTLQNLYDRHFAFGQNICAVGQVVGYGNNNDGSIENVEPQSYAAYREALKDLEQSRGDLRDPRFQVDHVIPWAFGWTGFIALPLATVHKYGLYFDENFHGWGIDDLEWSYRIYQSGTPIVLCEDMRAIHLPHIRNALANQKAEQQNYRYFLRKWPRMDVELAYTFGDIKANALFLEFRQILRKISGSNATTLGTVRGNIHGRNVLIIGVTLDSQYCVNDTNIMNLFDDWSRVEVLPLVGMALPYLDKSVTECYIQASVTQFPALYWNAIRLEVERVSEKVVLPSTLPHIQSNFDAFSHKY